MQSKTQTLRPPPPENFDGSESEIAPAEQEPEAEEPAPEESETSPDAEEIISPDESGNTADSSADETQPNEITPETDADVMPLAGNDAAFTIDANGVLTGFDPELYGSTDVVIPNSVTEIGYKAFFGCNRLTSVTIPDSVTSIGSKAFWECSNLNTATIEGNYFASLYFYEGSYCGPFSNCGLKTIIIKDGLKSIGTDAFYNCQSLTSVTIPTSVTTIDIGAFYNCKCLTSVTIPNRVTNIGGYAFSGCSGLTSITIPGSVTSIGEGAFSECSGLTSINIPERVTSISDYTFGYCKGLTSIKIPNSVTSIGEEAFSGCTKLIALSMPASVTTLGNNAVKGCTALKSITFKGNAPTGGTTLGTGLPADYTTIYQPTSKGFTNPWRGYPAKDPTALTKTQQFVTRMYKLILERSVDPIGLNYYSGMLDSKKMTAAQFAASIINSAEFAKKNVSDGKYLDLIYQALMGRSADSGGKKYWQGFLDKGMSRKYILSEFIKSKEFTNICAGYGISRGSYTSDEARDKNGNVTAFVQRLYKNCLGRKADAGGLNYWCGRLLNGQVTGMDTANFFFFSPEFINKKYSNAAFVDRLYSTLMDRSPDAGGKNYWITRLNNGTPRLTAVAQYADSQEFKNICAKYGIRHK